MGKRKTDPRDEELATLRSGRINDANQIAAYKETISLYSRAHEELRLELDAAKSAPSCAAPLERRRLPDTRQGVARTLRIGTKADGVSAHIHVGEYEDGTAGEVFLRLGACMDKSLPEDQVDWRALAIRLGYLARTFADSWATAVSIGLQYGVPLEVFLSKHVHQQDVPGVTGDREYPRVNGLLDYLSRWMARRYLKTEGEKP